jgi:gamma-glutamyltranspeptidase/glutathione hydrolase
MRDREIRPRFHLGTAALAAILLTMPITAAAERPNKPVLHGQHWVAITGKPLGATAGAMIFQQGGNAVDAACAMLAATATMWDVLSWGGETQALIYHPGLKKVIGINALGVAPTGATSKFFKRRKMKYPPEYGPLAAVTPGTPGGLMVMLAEFGTMSLKQVLAPAMQLAEGYPIEAETADRIEAEKERLRGWPYSRKVLLVHEGEAREAPHAGEIFRQPDLLATLQKLVAAESEALAAGMDRKAAIQAAYNRFYKGDIAEEFVRSVKEQGGLITMQDLANWQVHLEEPVVTRYRGIDVYKLTTWVQSPVMLQALNMLENFDLKAMGYNTATYIHTVYQVMNLTFADRDFYYGDPYFPPEEPVRGLLSKDYAKSRLAEIDPEQNDAEAGPGDPYPYQGGTNPYLNYLEKRRAQPRSKVADIAALEQTFARGTTSQQAADAEGWVVSITPSGGWIPAVIAGRTGIGMSQRMQSFVLDPADNPFNVVEPGKRPRATLTPSLALKDGRPYLSFAVQGGDTQDQNLLQFFINVVDFGMNVQEAAEAANITSFQMHDSFGNHEIAPGRIMVNAETPEWTIAELKRRGYKVETRDRTSGPINAIWFDHEHGTFWGGSSDHGEDYGIAW